LQNQPDVRIRLSKLSAVAASLLAVTVTATPGERPRPFVFLAPDIVVTAADESRLNAGEVVTHFHVDRDGFVSLSAIVRIEANGPRLIAWASSVETLYRGRYVPEIGRFSAAPQLEDLRDLTLEPDDLDDLPDCEPGDCGVKLSGPEIAEMAALRDPAARDRAFRQMMVRRATEYLIGGDSCGSPYRDHQKPLSPPEMFGALLTRLPSLSQNMPCYARYLRSYPAAPDSHVQQSFLYWSKETLGIRPIISITHFSAARFESSGLPEAVVIAKQVYATHYKTASLALTAVVSDQSARYLVYLNRSHVDAFHGLFGGLVRHLVERRVRAEAPELLLAFRKRLESGDPDRIRGAH
jgi:hypothetical protein